MCFLVLGRRVFNLNARKISQPGNYAHRMLLVFEDITHRKQRERDALTLTNEISTVSRTTCRSSSA